MVNIRRLFSVVKPGPLGTTCTVVPPSTSPPEKDVTVSASTSPVSLYQSVRKTAFSAATAGPSTRMVSSTQALPARRFLGLS